MKMLVLTVPILAALGARVVLAESESGDTWSAVETVQKSTYSVLQHTPQLDSSRPTLDDPFVGSEGGDTWSRFVPQFQSQPAGSADMASAHNGANDH
jgi:hypothetical protein